MHWSCLQNWSIRQFTWRICTDEIHVLSRSFYINNENKPKIHEEQCRKYHKHLTVAARLKHSETYRLRNVFPMLTDRDSCIKMYQDIRKLPAFKISFCTTIDTWDSNLQHSFRGQLSNSSALMSSYKTACSTCGLCSWFSNPEKMSACKWMGKVHRWNKNIIALSPMLLPFFPSFP